MMRPTHYIYIPVTAADARLIGDCVAFPDEFVRTNANKFHITMLALVLRSEEDIKSATNLILQSILADAFTLPFDLRFNAGIHTFPDADPARAKVLFAEPNPYSELRLSEMLRVLIDRFDGSSFVTERELAHANGVTFHATVALARNPVDARSVIANCASIEFVKPTIVNKLCLARMGNRDNSDRCESFPVGLGPFKAVDSIYYKSLDISPPITDLNGNTLNPNQTQTQTESQDHDHDQ